MPYTGADYKKPERRETGQEVLLKERRESEVDRPPRRSRRSTKRKSQMEDEESEEEEEEDEDSEDESEEDEVSEDDIEVIGPDGLGWWQPDGLHLTVAGAAVLGKKIAKEVEQFLRIQSVFRGAKKQTVQLTI